MNILFCGDKNIQNGLLIAVISLLEHTKEDLDVYVLTLNMSVNDKHYEPIDGRLSDYCNTELSKKYDNRLRIKFIDTSGLFNKEVPLANMSTRFTPCCMLRLFADEIAELPDRLLYLDTDIICRKDFTEFYYQNMENVEIAGVLDYYGLRIYHLLYNCFKHIFS